MKYSSGLLFSKLLCLNLWVRLKEDRKDHMHLREPQ